MPPRPMPGMPRAPGCCSSCCEGFIGAAEVRLMACTPMLPPKRICNFTTLVFGLAEFSCTLSRHGLAPRLHYD